MSTGSTGTDAAGDAAPDGGQPDPSTAPASSHRVTIWLAISSSAAPFTQLDADKAREALASNNCSFMIQDGRVRVSSTRRDNPLYSAPQTGDCDSGAWLAISTSDGTGTFTQLDADKAQEALASNNSSFMLQDGRVRVSSTRRDNPLYSAPQTGDRDSGAWLAISSSDGTGTFTQLDADKAREALASNNSSFTLQEGRVRVSSTRRENPLYSSQTGDRDSGAFSLTSISEIEEQYAYAGGADGPEDYLSWGGGRDEAEDADDVMITYPHRKFNMRPSNALRGAGPILTRRSSDDDAPPAEGAYPLLVGGGGGFRGFGFATLDMSVSSNLGDLESDNDFSLPTSLEGVYLSAALG